MLNILAAVLLFGFIVLVHEFDIFCWRNAAESGLWSFLWAWGPHFQCGKGETRYSIKALPFWRFLHDGGRGRGKPGSEGF